MAAIESGPVKDDEDRRKHGLLLEIAELLSHGSYIEEVDDRQDYGETRFIVTGPIAAAGDHVFVAV